MFEHMTAQKPSNRRLKAKKRLEQMKMNKILSFAKIPLRNVLLVTLRNEVK